MTEPGKRTNRYEIPGTDLESVDIIYALGHGPSFCLGNAIKYLVRASNTAMDTQMGSLVDEMVTALQGLKSGDDVRPIVERTFKELLHTGSLKNAEPDLRKARHYIDIALNHPPFVIEE